MTNGCKALSPRPATAHRHLIAGAAMAAALLGATAAHAQRSQIYYSLIKSTTGNNITALDNVSGFVTASGPSAGWSSIPSPAAPYGTPTGTVGTASIGAQSSIGNAKVSISGQGAGYNAFVQGSWDDNITFTGAPAGSFGTVSFQMGWDWTSSVTANAGGQGQTQPYIDLLMKPVGLTGSTGVQYGQVYQLQTQTCSAANVCSSTDSGILTDASSGSNAGALYPQPVVTTAGQTGTFRFTVEFGRTYNLMAAIGAFVDGQNAQSFVDATHSLNWKGIAGVVNAQGQAVNYSVSSASGFNYASAVPEPAPGALLALGLPVLAWGARSRRRRSPT